MNGLPPLGCDTCGAQADAVHFLPWVNDCERVTFTCRAHDDGGYWYALDRFKSMVAHIAESKRGGFRALALLFARIQVAQDEEEERWDRHTTELLRRKGRPVDGLRMINLDNEFDEIAAAVDAENRQRFGGAK